MARWAAGIGVRRASAGGSGTASAVGRGDGPRPQFRTSMVMSGTGRLNWRLYSASNAARRAGRSVGQVSGAGSGISISCPCPW
jgi:hypothetical protein